VGRLSDGKTLGFWLLVLARPAHGRALPCAFITDSEGTVAQEATSRHLEHQRAFRKIKELLGEKPLGLDREFSDAGLFQAAEKEGVKDRGATEPGDPPHADGCGGKPAASF